MNSFPSLESLGFAPRRSNHYASWIPLYLEPMVGSGERLCIGVVVSDKEEDFVCAVPSLERLNCVYGSEASAFSLSSQLAIETVKKRIKKHGFTSLLEWECPVEGLFIGPSQRGAGENLRDVARTALMQCASLATRMSEEVDTLETSSRADSSMIRLETLVKDVVRAQRPDLIKYFSATFRVAEHARATKIGFAGTKLVANFGMLLPGKLSPLVNTAKARLWDLEQLKSGVLSQSLSDNNLREFELLLHRPRHDDPQFNDRQIQMLDAACLELEEAADKAEIRCRTLDSPTDMANFLLEKEAA